jgi:transcriptional regulator with XRE-family HTH domain
MKAKHRGYGFNPEKLVTWRKRRGLSQRQLASATGLTAMSIARYEQGQAEPRIDSVELLARELRILPSALFHWGPEVGREDIDPGIGHWEPGPYEDGSEGPPPEQKPRRPKARKGSADRLAENLSLLGKFDLHKLQYVIDAITRTNNPLDADWDLYNQDLEVLQKNTPNVLRKVRNEFSLSIYDLAMRSGIVENRLTGIEEGPEHPVQAEEILALRKALGVAFDPRNAEATRLKLFADRHRRSAETKLKESVRLWRRRCQRMPNKLDTLLQKVSNLEADLKAGLERIEKAIATTEVSRRRS